MITKDIINFIKGAQGEEIAPAAHPGSKKPTFAPPASGNPEDIPAANHQGVSRAPANTAPEVKNMQEALQLFAKAVTGYSASSGQMTQASSGKKAFNDFITEGFMAEKPIKGVEWTTDQTVTQVPDKQKTESDLYEMEAVVSDLSRLGSAKSEMKVDGVWGPRTTNAVNNIVAFAKALMEIDKRFTGKAPTDFTDKNVAFLEAAATLKPSDFLKPAKGGDSIVREDGISQKAKFLKGSRISTVAQNTANTVKALTKYYTDFLQRTLSNPKNAIFIQQDKPLDKVSKRDAGLKLDATDQQLLSEIEKDKTNSSANIKVTLALPPDNIQKTYTIPLYYLTNKARFKEFCEQQKIRSTEGILKVLNDIQAQMKRV